MQRAMGRRAAPYRIRKGARHSGPAIPQRAGAEDAAPGNKMCRGDQPGRELASEAEPSEALRSDLL